MKENTFVTGVEQLVDPIEVANLHVIQKVTGSLPISFQRKMAKSGAKTTPYMGFVVEPYSFYLGYEVNDLKKAQAMLPDHFRLAKTTMYDGDIEKYYGIIGVFNARTSGFMGLRVEFYLIAEDLNSGLLSWVIVDYDTNTISYEPKNGFVSPNATGSLFTIDYNGTIHIDVRNNEMHRVLNVQSNIKQAKTKTLPERLWIEGNLSIGYGLHKTIDDSEVFGLKFDPKEFGEALLIDIDQIDIKENNWFSELLENEPSTVLCFPYAQHFLSDAPGSQSNIKNKEELIETINTLDLSQVKVFSTKPIKKLLLFGVLSSITLNILLLLGLLLT